MKLLDIFEQDAEGHRVYLRLKIMKLVILSF
jgi:hypothetical protein